MNNKKINWGILATGKIASHMANALTYVDDANLLAVASRSIDKAKQFAQEKNISRYYGSYEELVKDPEIDLVYIATPSSSHYEDIILCLKNEKNVLCEKPFTLNQKQAQDVIKLAQDKKLFLMEAHWSQFLPGIKKVKELIKENAIGKIVLTKADFYTKPVFDAQNRLFDLELGGGALLDLGVYPISLALTISGYPTEINSQTTIGDTGVDISNAITFKHKNGSHSVLNCGLSAKAPIEAFILGEDGYIKIHEDFHHPNKITLKSGNNDPIDIDVSYTGNGYNYEAEEVNKCLKSGQTECLDFSFAKTLEILKITDFVRKQCNLIYPQEVT